jgi:hypothetical protein
VIGAEKKVSQSTGARTLRHSSCWLGESGWAHTHTHSHIHSCSAKNNNKRRGPRSPAVRGRRALGDPDQPQPAERRSGVRPAAGAASAGVAAPPAGVGVVQLTRRRRGAARCHEVTPESVNLGVELGFFTAAFLC